MRNRTTHARDRKVYDVLSQLTRMAVRLPRRLFAADDTAARRHGWQVTSIHGGFGRRYRDPRFDALRTCDACQGRGTEGHQDLCHRCTGTGRLITVPATRSRCN